MFQTEPDELDGPSPRRRLGALGALVVRLLVALFARLWFLQAVPDESLATTAEPGIIELNSDAGCPVTGEPATELEYEDGHAELTASWEFTCATPDEITEFDASGLFDAFANLEDIDAQWVSDTGQSAAELTPSSSTMSLR